MNAQIVDELESPTTNASSVQASVPGRGIADGRR